MTSLLKLHISKIIALAVSLLSVLGVNAYLGETQLFENITWLDIFGEGSTLIMAIMFLLFVLNSRPRGSVTNYLYMGFLCFCLAMWQDLLDEIIQLHSHYWFDDVIESFIAPAGIVMMGLGIYYWDQEQQRINEQLQTRERFYREHSALDFVTQLYSAHYMYQQIDYEIALRNAAHNMNNHCSLLLIDIDQFNDFNLQHGCKEGDRLLKQIADLITMNLRTHDLACRYAGDRFIVLLPNSDAEQSRIITQELQQALESLAFKLHSTRPSHYLNVTLAHAHYCRGEDTDSWLLRLNKQLQHNKAAKRLQAA